MQMWITYPPNFDPAKKWPLLQTIHGGPHSQYGEGWFDEFQNLAAQYLLTGMRAAVAA